MQRLLVRQFPSATFKLNEDMNDWECTHAEAYVVRACCSPFSLGSSGYVECGCHGQDSVTCPAIDCTGIQDWEVEELFERLS